MPFWVGLGGMDELFFASEALDFNIFYVMAGLPFAFSLMSLVAAQSLSSFAVLRRCVVSLVLRIGPH